jgi:hypothetical protein
MTDKTDRKQGPPCGRREAQTLDAAPALLTLPAKKWDYLLLLSGGFWRWAAASERQPFQGWSVEHTPGAQAPPALALTPTLIFQQVDAQ